MVAVCFVYLALGMTGIAHQAFCELVGDPHLKTFAGELSPVPIPCMYWATHFYVRKDSDVNKHCKVMVSVVNSPEPVGGQYFVIAAKVIVSIVTGADPSNPTSKTRQTVYYISSDAITKAKVNSKTSAWTLIGTAQSFVDTIYESVTNRAKLTIPSHNVTVTFTPIDTTQTVQTRLSGLVLATPNTTVWLNADFPNTLCSSIWAKDTIRERKREWNQTAGHVAVYGVLVQQLEDPIPGDNNDGCEAAVTEFGECGTETKRMLAVQTCAPLVAKTSLASCLPSPAMEVVANCFKYQCHKDNYSACLELKAATAQCPEFKTYVSLNC
ncbi:uncharacterized protein [Littorina saxatilis]|uniref:uncharacterized protein n=1 Tax=Littorina saxatilis TaxID=31220 RepID=UPI0038B5B502